MPGRVLHGVAAPLVSAAKALLMPGLILVLLLTATAQFLTTAKGRSAVAHELGRVFSDYVGYASRSRRSTAPTLKNLDATLSMYDLRDRRMVRGAHFGALRRERDLPFLQATRSRRSSIHGRACAAHRRQARHRLDNLCARLQAEATPEEGPEQEAARLAHRRRCPPSGRWLCPRASRSYEGASRAGSTLRGARRCARSPPRRVRERVPGPTRRGTHRSEPSRQGLAARSRHRGANRAPGRARWQASPRLRHHLRRP